MKLTAHQRHEYDLGYFDGDTDARDNVVSDEYMRQAGEDQRGLARLRDSPDFHYFMGYCHAINHLPPRAWRLDRPDDQ